MTPRDFCYWLRGCLELGKIDKMDEEQVEILKKHLDLVFVDVTSESPPKEDPKKEILTDEKKGDKIREIIDRARERQYRDPFDNPTTWCSSTSLGLRLC